MKTLMLALVLTLLVAPVWGETPDDLSSHIAASEKRIRASEKATVASYAAFEEMSPEARDRRKAREEKAYVDMWNMGKSPDRQVKTKAEADAQWAADMAHLAKHPIPPEPIAPPPPSQTLQNSAIVDQLRIIDTTILTAPLYQR